MAALAWVEYCNSAGDTYWANRRRVNGRAAPYQVTYWGLGNEMYGDWQVGAFSAEEYVREGDQVGAGDPDARPEGQAGQLRDERLERVGPGRHRRDGRDGRLPLTAHLHQQRRLLDQRAAGRGAASSTTRRGRSTTTRPTSSWPRSSALRP